LNRIFEFIKVFMKWSFEDGKGAVQINLHN